MLNVACADCPLVATSACMTVKFLLNVACADCPLVATSAGRTVKLLTNVGCAEKAPSAHAAL